MLLAYSYTAISPVFLYTPIDIGGLGFSDQYIAGFFAVAGVSQALWMLLAFPFLQKRLGTGRLLRICAVIYPLELAMFPFLNELLRRNLTTAFWAIGAPGLVIGSGISMAFGTHSPSLLFSPSIQSKPPLTPHPPFFPQPAFSSALMISLPRPACSRPSTRWP